MCSIVLRLVRFGAKLVSLHSQPMAKPELKSFEIPDSECPADESARSKCKQVGKSIVEAWEYVTFVNTLDAPRNPLVSVLKPNLINYIVFCKNHSATAPVYIMRFLTSVYPESGVTWYGLLTSLLLIKGEAVDKEEFLSSLTNAARFGCEYVTKDAEGRLTFRPLS